MEHNTDLVKTCNCCESQEFSTLEYAGEHFYRCFHCEAVDDYRMASEREELELDSQPERKPAASELHPVFAEIVKNFMKEAK